MNFPVRDLRRSCFAGRWTSFGRFVLTCEGGGGVIRRIFTQCLWYLRIYFGIGALRGEK